MTTKVRVLVILRVSLGQAEILPEGVEHVLFRSKVDFHATHSRWLVGVVNDLELYEKYLLYANKAVEDVNIKVSLSPRIYGRQSQDGRHPKPSEVIRQI